MGRVNLIITNESDYRKPEKGILPFSNQQWRVHPAKLEGYEFDKVIVRCTLDDELRNWLYMHIGFRINEIIYDREEENG